MQNTRFSIALMLGLTAPALITSGQALAAAPTAQAAGEPSRTAPAPALHWRAAAYPTVNVARMQYREMATSRLLDLQRKNQAPGLKATQIGIGREASQEGAQRRLPTLSWKPVAGGFVAKVEIRSMDALALRVGLDVSRLDSRVELRFGGSARPSEVVAKMTGAEVKRLPGSNGLFWTPNTDGDTQIIEIFRPKAVPAFAVRLDAPVLSHLIADSRNTYKIIEKIGESDPCNVDTICRVNALGQAFVNTKNAVAHMRFVIGSNTFICTGTLLTDTVPVTQVPYFHTANHCFSSNTNVAPVATQMQTVANTLNTIWNYETTACGNVTSTVTTPISGGATYLYSNHLTDGMLLRLNNAPPANAYFAGWNAAPIADGSSVLAIHHPRGDSKKVSGGETITKDGDNITVGWLTGTTEGGSSGSGLFTLGPRGYVLRGGLYGGTAACSNSGSLGNTQNRDYYSRLDVDFASMKQYLEPQPQAAEGASPLVRPRPSAKPAAAPSVAATSAPATGRRADTIDRSHQRLSR